MQQELGCDNLNQLIIKIVLTSKRLLTNENLEHLSTKINNNRIFSAPAPNKTNSRIMSDDDHYQYVLFPLFKLPIDLITNTLLFLNEKQLLLIECCNRILYQMINNYTFLKKCKTFKHFRLTNRFLDNYNATQHQFDCYKYCAAKVFEFDLYMSERHVGPANNRNNRNYLGLFFLWQQETRKKFSNMIDLGCKSNPYYSNWLTMLFKSIETLVFDADGMLLLDLLPIELLFDKEHSQLKRLRMECSMRNAIPIQAFGTYYNNYFSNNKDRRGKSGKVVKSKVLYMIECVNVYREFCEHVLGLLCMKHLYIGSESHIDKTVIGSHLRTITLDELNIERTVNVIFIECVDF